MPSHLAQTFADQATACGMLGSPFMAQLCTLFATRDWPEGQIRDRILAWPGDITPAGASVPLRLAGALHALHLVEHARLTPVYPPQTATDNALWGAVCDVLKNEATHIDTWLNFAPQTNEVRRSAVLIAAGHLLQNRYEMPIDMVELGASAGLNLMWDHFALTAQGQTFGASNAPLTLAPDWDGDLPFSTPPRVTSRRGVDLNPLDPHVDSLRLRAYLWPYQPHRWALTDAAIASQTAQVEKGDAIDWLAQNLTAKPSHIRLIYHTVAWQYFPNDLQTTGTALITAAGAQATDDTPLAWFGMENDGTGTGAALTLRLWPGDLTFDLGRADFHGRWVTWRNPPDQHHKHMQKALIKMEKDPSFNVLGSVLETCSTDPVTGFFRDGACNTCAADAGSHTVCAVMTEEFLAFSKYVGNDLSTPRPEFGFAGLKAGDGWCLCASRFLQAHEEGCAPNVNLHATHVRALEIVPIDVLRGYGVGQR